MERNLNAKTSEICFSHVCEDVDCVISSYDDIWCRRLLPVPPRNGSRGVKTMKPKIDIKESLCMYSQPAGLCVSHVQGDSILPRLSTGAQV